jgi:hypothetical protein
VSIVASNYFDDGAVVYVNGAEAFRYNMPAGSIGYNTLALAANPAGEGTFIVSNIPTHLLVQGTNTVAVEVHQNSIVSADIAFGMALHVRSFATHFDAHHQRTRRFGNCRTTIGDVRCRCQGLAAH